MKKTEILHFQNITVENAQIAINPLISQKVETKNTISVVFIRNPYEYFDYLLFDYLDNKRSILFTKEIKKQLKKLNATDFLVWLDTLNFIPLYNPQTFQLDVRKRLKFAIENLERFDYVVPYEEIDLFLENVSLKLDIQIVKENKHSFSLSSVKESSLVTKFTEKDNLLYIEAKKLWNLSKENDFKSLKELIEQKTVYVDMNETENFKGASGVMNEKSIRGYALNLNSQKSLNIEIYINNQLLCTTKADMTRKDIADKFQHSNEECGFLINFDKPTFKKGDDVDIIIVPENIRVPIVGNAQKFLEK